MVAENGDLVEVRDGDQVSEEKRWKHIPVPLDRFAATKGEDATQSSVLRLQQSEKENTDVEWGDYVTGLLEKEVTLSQEETEKLFPPDEFDAMVAPDTKEVEQGGEKDAETDLYLQSLEIKLENLQHTKTQQETERKSGKKKRQGKK